MGEGVCQNEISRGKEKEPNNLKLIVGAGEMDKQLRTLAALPEDLGSVPSTHMASYPV